MAEKTPLSIDEEKMPPLDEEKMPPLSNSGTTVDFLIAKRDDAFVRLKNAEMTVLRLQMEDLAATKEIIKVKLGYNRQSLGLYEELLSISEELFRLGEEKAAVHSGLQAMHYTDLREIVVVDDRRDEARAMVTELQAEGDELKAEEHRLDLAEIEKANEILVIEAGKA